MDTTAILMAALALFVAGTVKGAAGMGLPTTAIALLTLSLAPRMAIALVLIPMIVSNAWQVYRSGHVWPALRRYLPFGLCLAVMVGATVALTDSAPDRLLLGLLGSVILLFVLVSVTRWSPHIAPERDRPAQIVAGAIAGVMGGLTSVWAPPLAVYLAARQTPKDEFVRASGLLIFIGSLPLAWGYARQGFLTAELAWISAALLVPTIAGFTLGEAIRERLSEAGFRRVLLLVFALMGLNLLRRALLGG